MAPLSYTLNFVQKLCSFGRWWHLSTCQNWITCKPGW